MEKIKVIRIGREVNSYVKVEVDRIVIMVHGEKYTITPEIDSGFRVSSHRRKSGYISIKPGCANEVIIQ